MQTSLSRCTVSCYIKVELCRIPKGIGIEQALTHLEVKILFDDSTYYVDDDATEADTMVDVVYEVDSDDKYFLMFTFNKNIYYKLPCSNAKLSSLFVSLSVLPFYILRNI